MSKRTTCVMKKFESLTPHQQIAVMLMESRRVVNACMSDKEEDWKGISEQLLYDYKFILFLAEKNENDLALSHVAVLIQRILRQIKTHAANRVKGIPWPINLSLSTTMRLLRRYPAKPYMALEH